jgi:hypothetical protein
MNSQAWQLLLGVAVAVAGGPITGFWMLISNGRPIAPACPLLALGTALPLVPFLAWLRYRRSFLLALAVLFWLSAGYYFAIGMWV